MVEELTADINARAFILWCLFRTYLRGESDYNFWLEAFMASKKILSHEQCNPFLVSIHEEINKLIHFYRDDYAECRNLKQIKQHLHLYFPFKPLTHCRVK